MIDYDVASKDDSLNDFYRRYVNEPLAIDKWFAVQAMAEGKDTLSRVKSLVQHDDFTLRNPNRLRALVGSFAAANQVRFHAANGEGYEFLRDIVAQVDRLNPQTAARLVSPLTRHKRYDTARSDKMRFELAELLKQPDLSKDVFEIVSKSLHEQ